MIGKKTLSIVHPYIEGRKKDIEMGLYPRQHLWGMAKIKSDQSLTTKVVETQQLKLSSLLEKTLNKFLFRGSPGAKTEIATWIASKSSDLIYSVCGPLSLSRFYKRAKLVSWVFRKPERSTRQSFDPYSSKNLDSHAAFLCLTQSAEKSFSKHSFTKFLPWCVDLEMFDGKPPEKKPDRPYFLATGKTGRDYETLLTGAEHVAAELRIIGPKQQRPPLLPKNVKWIDTTEDPPDQAIDYLTLREWYAQCIAVCIPLYGDAEDTCGYTNMLEAMAMAKPVLMTSSGCLHINPETRNFGCSIEPGNPNGWVQTMGELLENEDQAKILGRHGREIAQNEFSTLKFDRQVVGFLKEILQK